MKGIILYGPPASGKDTITTALSTADPQCRLFRRLKAGGGKSSTYRIVSNDHLEELESRSEIIWRNDRYRATYAVDTPGLRKALREGIPVLHLGQLNAIPAVKSAIPEALWLVVELWCARNIAAARLTQRDPLDAEERLWVWDETARLSDPDLHVDTGRTDPADVVRTILTALAPTAPIRSTSSENPSQDADPPR